MDRYYVSRNAYAMPNNLRAVRDRKGIKQPQIAAALGVSIPQVSRWETGKDNVPSSRLRAFESAYGATVGELFGVETDPNQIPVVGYVGAGAAVYPLDDVREEDGFDTVERPPFVHGDAIAVEVRGDSLIPVAEDGWRLIYASEQALLEDEVLNKLCVVMLADGRILVKRIVRGSIPRRYHLVSTNAPLIEDAEVVWAARVKAIIPV